MGRKSIYSNEFKQSVVEFFKSHTTKETANEFSIPEKTVSNLVYRSGYKKGCAKHSISFKHEVCQFYDNNTGSETSAKFGVSPKTLATWRRELGYRNKFHGYNLYTEGLQPTVTKRERRNFMMTKAENGQLQGELMEIKLQYAVLEREFKQLKEAIMEAVQ
jgi:transposase-like protein